MSEKPVESVATAESQSVPSEVNDVGKAAVAEEQEGTRKRRKLSSGINGSYN